AAPLAVAGFDDALARGAQLLQLRSKLRLQTFVLEGEACCRRDGIEQLLLIAKRGIVYERGHASAVALEDGDRPAVGRLDRCRAAVDPNVALRLGDPARELERRVAKCARKRIPEPPWLRHPPQLDDEVTDAEAREMRVEQTEEKRERHRCERDLLCHGEP